MSRLFIILTVITSTLFTTQIPESFDTDGAKEETLNTLQKKKKLVAMIRCLETQDTM